MKISVVIPYYNEKKTILKTLNEIKKQTYKPSEIILIDSSSTDNSFYIVQNWIKKNKYEKIYKNFKTKSKFPSSSKNIGIKKAKNKWIAFMDCDLNLKKKWLENQVKLIKIKNCKAVFGLCYLKGHNLKDISFVAQTWGYENKVPVIPSSIIHISVFYKIGFFKNLRAGYDRQWIRNFDRNFKKVINNKSIITYNSFNHSKNFINFIKKIYIYSKNSFYTKDYHHPKFYLIFLLFLIMIYFISVEAFKLTLISYILLRGIVFPFLKSSKKIFFIKKPTLIILLIISGVLVDGARLTAFIYCWIKKIFIPIKRFF